MVGNRIDGWWAGRVDEWWAGLQHYFTLIYITSHLRFKLLTKMSSWDTTPKIASRLSVVFCAKTSPAQMGTLTILNSFTLSQRATRIHEISYGVQKSRSFLGPPYYIVVPP